MIRKMRVLELPLILAFIFVAISCTENELDRGEIIRPVRYQTVSLGGGNQNRTFSGVSKAAVEVELSFKVGGTVKSVNVKVGDNIKRNQLIASLDAADFRLRSEQANASVTNAKSQMQTAKSAFERVSALYENRNVSLQEFEQSRSSYESARAAFQSSKKGLQLAQSQLSYTKLKSPMDGIITRINIEKNENITSGKVVAEINSGKDIEVEIGIPESYISLIKSGEQVKVTFSSIPEKSFQGTVSEISYKINSASSTFPVCIILKKPAEGMRPGMVADVSFNFKSDNSTPRIIVPINTIAEDRKGRFVFTLVAQDSGFGVVQKRSVVTGELAEGGIEVVSGLKENELIVTAGISRLIDSMKVRLLK